MKKCIVSVICLALLIITANSGMAMQANASPAQSLAPANPVEQLTGTIWMQSAPNEKAALLFGVECAIAIEQAIANKMQETEKSTKRKSLTTLSPFEKGWTKAFHNVSREKIVENIDAWYTKNPTQSQRPVFDVIWYELIAPNTK